MTVTLDSIRQAADAKYGSYDIDLGEGTILRLLNPLRLSEEKRAELKAVQKLLTDSTEDEDADQVDLFQQAIVVVADSADKAGRLFEAIGRDLALYAEIFAGYGEGTQVGEASASAT